MEKTGPKPSVELYRSLFTVLSAAEREEEIQNLKKKIEMRSTDKNPKNKL